MVAKGIAALFQKNSPLAIKFRVDPALWSWLVHFALRCNHRDMMAAARGIQPLLESSLELYRELIEREHLECEWQKKGLLFAYRSKELMDAYAATDHLLAESFHCPARRLRRRRPGTVRAGPQAAAWRAPGIMRTMPTCVPTG